MVIGGAQDNGTKVGGVDATLGLNQDNNTSMTALGSGDGVAVGIGKLDNTTQFYFGTQQGNMYAISMMDGVTHSQLARQVEMTRYLLLIFI